MKKLLTIAALFAPSVTLAQTPATFSDIVAYVISIIQTLIALIFALTLLVLMWTIVKTWILSGGDEQEIEKGKSVITVGVVVLVVMSGIWGIIELLQAGLFGL